MSLELSPSPEQMEFYGKFLSKWNFLGILFGRLLARIAEYLLNRILRDVKFHSKDVDLYNTRKRYAGIESLDLMRNISWLVGCFSKIKKPNKHCSGNQSVIAGVCILT